MLGLLLLHLIRDKQKTALYEQKQHQDCALERLCTFQIVFGASVNPSDVEVLWHFCEDFHFSTFSQNIAHDLNLG